MTLDIKTQNKAADGDASAIFKLALSYKSALEVLPDKVFIQQNEPLQINRLILANEFYKALRDSAEAGSTQAREYIQELTQQNEIPLERYDGKLFSGMADLAQEGDESAGKIAISISNGLKSALMDTINNLNFPGGQSDTPKRIAQDLLHAKSDTDLDAISTTVQKSFDVFENARMKSAQNPELYAQFNEQADSLTKISKGLDIYQNMIKTLDEIDHAHPTPA